MEQYISFSQFYEKLTSELEKRIKYD